MQLADGAILPVLQNGMGAGSGSGYGIGGGVLGGAIAGALTGGLLNNRGGGWGGNGYNGGVGGPAVAAVATDIVLNPAFQSIQHQISGIEDTLNAHNIDAGLTSVNQNISGTSRDLGRDIANLATAQANGNFVTLTSINGLGRDVTAQSNQNALQQLNSFNQLTTATLQGFNGAAMQLQNVTNQIVSNQAAAAAALASCCCELKSLIVSDGGLTRALINANTMQDLRDRNVVLAGEVSNFRQNQFLIDKLSGSVIS